MQHIGHKIHFYVLKAHQGEPLADKAKDMDEEFGARFGKEFGAKFGVKFGVNEKRRHHRRTKHKKHVLW